MVCDQVVDHLEKEGDGKLSWLVEMFAARVIFAQFIRESGYNRLI